MVVQAGEAQRPPYGSKELHLEVFSEFFIGSLCRNELRISNRKTSSAPKDDGDRHLSVDRVLQRSESSR